LGLLAFQRTQGDITSSGFEPGWSVCRDSKVNRGGCVGQLYFLVQEGQIGAEAVVRHVKSGGLGLKLSAMGDEDQKRLKALITRLRK